MKIRCRGKECDCDASTESDFDGNFLLSLLSSRFSARIVKKFGEIKKKGKIFFRESLLASKAIRSEKKKRKIVKNFRPMMGSKRPRGLLIATAVALTLLIGIQSIDSKVRADCGTWMNHCERDANDAKYLGMKHTQPASEIKKNFAPERQTRRWVFLLSIISLLICCSSRLFSTIVANEHERR